MLRASRLLLNIAINSVNADFKLHRAFTKSSGYAIVDHELPRGLEPPPTTRPDSRVFPLLTWANNLP